MSELILRVEYLTGRAIATAYHDRNLAEWPPHPARLYSALVAHWHESEEKSAGERAALKWLAKLGPPRIYASAASRRSVVPTYVPVNDTAVLKRFGAETARLEKLEDDMRVLEVELAKAKGAGDTKDIKKLEKTFFRAQKSIENARKKIQADKEADQATLSATKIGEGAPKSAQQLLPEFRSKQPRTFPSVSLHEPAVFFFWDVEDGALEEHRQPLKMLTARVSRLGHSSSLVSCALADEGPAFNWEPDAQGTEILRIPEENQIELLESAYTFHQGVELRVLPCRFQGYRAVHEGGEWEQASSTFSDDWLVFRRIGDRFPATAAPSIARAMRGALMSYSTDPPPELLTGHGPDGSVSTTTHLAIVPLPFVGHPHATGDLMGIALIPPRDVDPGELARIYDAVTEWEATARAEDDDDGIDCPPLRLTLGRSGVYEIERIAWGNSPAKTLRPSNWCASAREWITATPIALDRIPGDLFSRSPQKAAEAYRNAEESIARSCEHIGLPRPIRVEVHPSVPLVGATKARYYPPFPEGENKKRRAKVHARIEFDQPVTGPILLGAGRYLGLGLCMPLRERRRVQR